jgi:hypothetical protein
MQDRGRPFDVGPFSHADLDTGKMCGIAGGWVHQGQKRDPLGAEIWGMKAE